LQPAFESYQGGWSATARGKVAKRIKEQKRKRYSNANKGRLPGKGEYKRGLRLPSKGEYKRGLRLPSNGRVQKRFKAPSKGEYKGRNVTLIQGLANRLTEAQKPFNLCTLSAVGHERAAFVFGPDLSTQR